MSDARNALEALLDLPRLLLEGRPMDESLHAVTDTALQLLPADHASIRLLDRECTDLLLSARSGVGAGARPMSFQPGFGIIGWVVQHGRSAPLSLLLLDIDHFKDVNDTFGHAAGDRVLGAVADILHALVRRGDIVVRRGGDEFVLLLPGADQESATRVGRRIRDRVGTTPFDTGDGRALDCTVSVGIALWDGGESAESLERRADQAMYRAKQAGRNRVEIAEPE